jgi:CBS domain-containing protein
LSWLFLKNSQLPNQAKGKKMSKEKIHTEEYAVSGDSLVTKIKELLHESNIRRLTIKNEEGKSLIEIPLTLGVVGIVLMPVWAAIGAIAALVTDCTIVVEKVEKAAL